MRHYQVTIIVTEEEYARLEKFLEANQLNTYMVELDRPKPIQGFTSQSASSEFQLAFHAAGFDVSS